MANGFGRCHAAVCSAVSSRAPPRLPRHVHVPSQTAKVGRGMAHLPQVFGSSDKRIIVSKDKKHPSPPTGNISRACWPTKGAAPCHAHHQRYKRYPPITARNAQWGRDNRGAMAAVSGRTGDRDAHRERAGDRRQSHLTCLADPSGLDACSGSCRWRPPWIRLTIEGRTLPKTLDEAWSTEEDKVPPRLRNRSSTTTATSRSGNRALQPQGHE